MDQEEIPFDDHTWTERLARRVMEERERKLDEKERELEEAENRRLLQLKLSGVYPQEKRRQHQQRLPKMTAAEKKFEKRNKTLRESFFRPRENIETQMDILHRDESQTKRKDKNSNDNIDENDTDRDMNNDDYLEGVSGDKTDHGEVQNGDKDFESDDTQAEARTRRIHGNFKKLFEEEDLRQLYREAETLVTVGLAAKKK